MYLVFHKDGTFICIAEEDKAMSLSSILDCYCVKITNIARMCIRFQELINENDNLYEEYKIDTERNAPRVVNTSGVGPT